MGTRAFLLAVLVLWGCDEGEVAPPADGLGEGPPVSDGALVGDGKASSLVDFLVQGCAQRTAQGCEGKVPLPLTFVAVLKEEPTSVSWDLGDGSKPAGGRVVTHTYAKPGTYDVTLTVSESGGTTSEKKANFVVVTTAGSGAPCSSSDVCESGKCVCAKPDSCTFPLDQGLCLQECELNCPNEGDACVDLTPKGGGSGEPWRTQLCLPRCTSGGDCTRLGFSCTLAPSVVGWESVCLPSVLRFIGEPCRDAAGAPDPSMCVGAMCLDHGASGYCSWPCKAGTCPEGTRCAKFEGSETPVCLLRCGPGLCAADPLLSCEAPGGSGTFGFTVLGIQEPPANTFCAPKRCTADDDCGMVGACDAGFCVPKG
jgi:PKD repeat protein